MIRWGFSCVMLPFPDTVNFENGKWPHLSHSWQCPWLVSICWKYTSKYNWKTDRGWGEAAVVDMRMNGVFGWSRNVGPGIVPARPSPHPPRGSLGPLLGGALGSTVVDDEILWLTKGFVIWLWGKGKCSQVCSLGLRKLSAWWSTKWINDQSSFV